LYDLQKRRDLLSVFPSLDKNGLYFPRLLISPYINIPVAMCYQKFPVTK
jgi:hypothetical protein